MADEHWFDTLNKVLIRVTPRRAVLGAAVAVASAACGRPFAAAAKKGKDKRKNKDKKKPDKRRPGPSCSGGACAAVPEWTGNEEQIGFCETKCGRCKEAGTEFCIHAPDEEHPAVHATCCPRGELCCGDACCAPPKTCCDRPRGPVCVPESITCCPDEPVFGWCSSDRTCCPGAGCVNTTTDPNHCGQCTRLCAVDQRCVDSDCVDSEVDDDCRYPLIPDPCPRQSPGECVADQNIVCCDDFSCVVLGNPEDYFCCGHAANWPNFGCRRNDEGCSFDRSPPLATNCQRGNPVCGG